MIVYLIHFGEALHHARHYIGVTNDLAERLKSHAAGQGARLMQVITDAGISWALARIWEGDRKIERQLKRRKNAARICPHCAGAAALRRARHFNPKRKGLRCT